MNLITLPQIILLYAINPLDVDETSEINFKAIANLSILHHPISIINHNNLPAQNQPQPQINLHGNRKGNIERKAKIGKFG